MSGYSGKLTAVTGADGFIGSHLVEALVRSGASVRALVQYNSFGSDGWLAQLPDELRSRVDIRRGDVRDPHFISHFIAGTEIVFHLAALIAIPYSYVAPQSYIDTNVTGTLNVLEACRNHRVARLVHTSTSEVYGTARSVPITEAHPLQGQSPYSASKIAADHMAEAYARSFDLPVVILRPFNTFGPRQSERAVIPTAIRQFLDPTCEVVQIGDVAPVRDFNFVADIVMAFQCAGITPALAYGDAYNAGSGHGVTIAEVIDLLRVITGSGKPLKTDDARRRPAKSEVFILVASADRFHAATGWRSSTSLEEGLAATARWWQSEIQNRRQRVGAGFLI